MNEELLYTQEDMDEWIRTCEELQDKIKEQEETIEQLRKRPEMVYAEMTERLKAEVAIEKRMGEQKAKKACKETAKEIFGKLIKITEENFDGCLPLGVLKAWAIEYKEDI